MKARPAPQDPSMGPPSLFKGVNGMPAGLKQDFAGNGKRFVSMIVCNVRAGLVTAAAMTLTKPTWDTARYPGSIKSRQLHALANCLWLYYM